MIIKRLDSGDACPPGYAVFAYDYQRREVLVAIYGINLLLGLALAFWFFTRNCWREICLNRWDAYEQGKHDTIRNITEQPNQQPRKEGD